MLFPCKTHWKSLNVHFKLGFTSEEKNNWFTSEEKIIDLAFCGDITCLII